MNGWTKGTLRRRLAIGMSAASAVAIAVGALGLWAIGLLQLTLWQQTMPPEIRAAYDAMGEGTTPDAALLPQMMIYGEQLEQQWLFYDALSLLFCALLALAVAVAVSIWFSRRLVGPIEAVAVAASAVASGDLSARITEDANQVGETRWLQRNFNQLVEALEVAEREQRESAAAIAHELRTPITVVGLKLRSFLDGIGEPTPDQLRLLVAQVDLLARLVEDLRTLSLATAGRLELSRTSVDLAELATEVAEAMRPSLEKAGMTLTLQIARARVKADPLRLRQCIQALVDNAVMHAAAGGVVDIEVGERPDRAWLADLDRGPGFEPDAQMRAFDRFWRAESSRSRQTGGSGLGLSVVAAIAAAHDGSVSIDAREGGGGRLTLSLPRSA